jgi:ATP-dependent RNA helicase DDX3X
MPTSEDGRQTFMFSATFPKEIQRLAADFLRDYVFLAVGRVGSASKDVKQIVEFQEGHQKTRSLMNHLSSVENGLIVVFVETKRAADKLEYELSDAGFPATSIHGDRAQHEREAALAQFKSGSRPILVATDVASRGLDINGVTHVFNYDMPGSIEDYVLRIGRTGRVGHQGTAVSFVNENNRAIAKDLALLLEENEQEVPGWLAAMVGDYSSGRGGRGRGRGRGGAAFGGRDFRKDSGGDFGQRSDGASRGGFASGGRGGGGSRWRDESSGGDARAPVAYSNDNSAW